MRIKRMGLVAVMLFAFAILAYPLTAGAVVNWTKGGVAFSGGGDLGTDYDAGGIERPMVIIDGTNSYKMYYTGKGAVGGSPETRVLYASSSDGINWTPNHTAPVIPVGGSGAFDQYHTGFCWVIKDGSTYKMWYSGNNAVDPDGPGWQIGYATSSDGTTWVKYGSTPVVPKGAVSTDWDYEGVGAPTLIKDGSIYKMWYVGFNETQGTFGIGYAESPDGISWTKYNNPSNNGNPNFANSDPVLTPGNPGSWDNYEAQMPSVIKDGAVYRMWYYGIQSDGMPDRIGYAYSLNGISWTKYAGNPVMMNGPASSYDEQGAWDPAVVRDGNTYKMWYVGSSNCTQDGCFDQVAYATSSAYEGTAPILTDASVIALNRSPGNGGPQLTFSVIPQGPSPVDINAFYVEGPNGFVFILDESMIRDIMGQQLVSGASNVVSFNTSYNGTYTFKLFANNGQFAERSVNFTVPAPEISYPVDGTSGLDRRIVMGGGDQSGVTEYINGTTPTFKWKPYLGDTYYYRVRVWDMKQPYNLRCWYQSPFTIGSTIDGSGFMSATVPDSSYLKPNSNYYWVIEVSPTNDFWTTQHIARSNPYNFYTATKGSDPMPTGSVYMYSNRSFATGDQTIFGARVPGLAKWEILSTPSPFQVSTSGAPYYPFKLNANPPTQPNNDMGYYVPQPTPPNDYNGPLAGIASNALYTFSVSDGSTSYTEDVDFLYNPLVPMVTKNDGMFPVDNAYFNTLEPTLTWYSKGTEWYHRVRITSWNGLNIYQSNWTNGVAAGAQMSAPIPPNVLQNGVYRWWVEVANTNEGAVINRTQSQRQTLTLGTGAQGVGNYLLQAWGTGKSNLAGAFNNYGAGNGIWSTPDGANWSKLTDWVPAGMGAWGGGNLGALFTNYGAGNGLWSFDGASWIKMTDWMLSDGEAWGGTKFAASFTNYGTGNGIWSFDGSAWTKLTDWIPDRMRAWGSTRLAAAFSTYGTGNGIWSFDGSAWTKLTDWIPDDMGAWGAGKLAAKFSNYGSGNGIWSFDGSAWTKLTDWTPSGDMVAWGTSSLAAIFSNYGTGNGIWNFNGSGWEKLTDWVPDGMLAVGTTTLGAGFSNYGTGNGVWGYNGSWAKITDWIPDSGVSWGAGIFAGVFTNYGTGNGIWNFTGAWSKASDWIPAQELN
jgi:hypothetical protein